MIRTIIWFIWFIFSLIISIPFMFRVKYLIKKNRIKESEDLIYKCTNIWANSLLKLAGVKVNVHGVENIPKDKTVLFVGNHQGNFDIPIYITQIPKVIGFISKIEVEKIPLVRTWMSFLHCVFMDRSNLRKSGEAIIKGVKNLKNGHSIVIFPEGTRSKGDPIKEFKAGSFKLATKSKCPIVPVTMDGSFKVMEHGNGPWIKPATVNLYFHPAIETSNLTKEEQDILPKTVQNIIASKIS
ncbi:MAG: lysophospholipid acyltransferase family protein [Clostridium celatum]|nr:lysophospholipid acyltransferase family protein [Clostridium celatum]